MGGEVLKPGQAYLNGKVVGTNIDQDVAWKNGIFNFHQVALKDAIKKLSRWYDVEVEFKGDFSAIKLGGEIGMNLTLKEVLKGLEDADIHFELKEKEFDSYPSINTRPILCKRCTETKNRHALEA